VGTTHREAMSGPTNPQIVSVSSPNKISRLPYRPERLGRALHLERAVACAEVEEDAGTGRTAATRDLHGAGRLCTAS
jgi:hypothetical protein